MRQLVTFLVVLATLVFVAGAARAESEAARVVQAGTKARAENDLDTARSAFERAAAMDGDADASAEALFLLGDMDEQARAYASALEHYDASRAKSPSSRYAPRATTKADYLRARSEGGFAPLARLEELRVSPAAGNDPRSIDLLAEDLESFPPGLVKVEARMVVADAYVARLARRESAIAQYREVLRDPKADPLTARQAARALVEAYVDAGDLDQAEREVAALHDRLDPKFATSVGRLARRRTFRVLAVGDLAVVGALAALSLVVAWRRSRLGDVAAALKKTAPLTVVFVAYVALLGGFLASKYEIGNAKPFLAFGIVLVPVVIVARAWGAAGRASILARSFRAALCASSAVAAAFVLLDRLYPVYLESFGL